MRRIGWFLFSTSPRFGLTVGSLGVLLVFFDTIQGPEPPHLLSIGAFMWWTGFPWAALTAYLRPLPLGGFGVIFAVLALIVIPGVSGSEVECFALIDNHLFAFTVWLILCLSILVMVLASKVKDHYPRSRES